MAVVSIARFKADPARVKELFENAKKTKQVFLANGAERVFFGSVLAGTGPGEWTLMTLSRLGHDGKGVWGSDEGRRFRQDIYERRSTGGAHRPKPHHLDGLVAR